MQDNTSFPRSAYGAWHKSAEIKTGRRCSGTAESPRSFPPLSLSPLAAQDVVREAGVAVQGAVPAEWKH